MTLAELTAAWRERAELFDRHGAIQAAATLRTVANELDTTIAEAEAERLTLSEAAEACGYSERRLRELIADGSIPQSGRKGAPRIRRGDLPRRPSRPKAVNGYDPAADAQSLAARLQGGST